MRIGKKEIIKLVQNGHKPEPETKIYKKTFVSKSKNHSMNCNSSNNSINQIKKIDIGEYFSFKNSENDKFNINEITIAETKFAVSSNDKNLKNIFTNEKFISFNNTLAGSFDQEKEKDLNENQGIESRETHDKESVESNIIKNKIVVEDSNNKIINSLMEKLKEYKTQCCEVMTENDKLKKILKQNKSKNSLKTNPQIDEKKSKINRPSSIKYFTIKEKPNSNSYLQSKLISKNQNQQTNKIFCYVASSDQSKLASKKTILLNKDENKTRNRSMTPRNKDINFKSKNSSNSKIKTIFYQSEYPSSHNKEFSNSYNYNKSYNYTYRNEKSDGQLHKSCSKSKNINVTDFNKVKQDSSTKNLFNSIKEKLLSKSKGKSPQLGINVYKSISLSTTNDTNLKSNFLLKKN